ncbi:hypothetical protein H0H93_013914 [Arthromyces matolae]|nr:hypothetical protein H0H93_013914 [Arthromyces matolae]
MITKTSNLVILLALFLVAIIRISATPLPHANPNPAAVIARSSKSEPLLVRRNPPTDSTDKAHQATVDFVGTAATDKNVVDRMNNKNEQMDVKKVLELFLRARNPHEKSHDVEAWAEWMEQERQKFIKDRELDPDAVLKVLKQYPKWMFACTRIVLAGSYYFDRPEEAANIELEKGWAAAWSDAEPKAPRTVTSGFKAIFHGKGKESKGKGVEMDNAGGTR